MKTHWYDSRAVIIVLFFLLPPVGIYGMAKRDTVLWKKLLYMIPSGFVCLFWLVAIIAVAITDDYKNGVDYYNKHDYLKAYDAFNRVGQKDKNYKNAIAKMIEIKPKADSIRAADALAGKSSGDIKIDSAAMLKASNRQTLDHLKKEIASIDKGIDFSGYRNSVESIQMEIVLFGAWAKTIEEAAPSDDPEIQKAIKLLQQKVSKIQVSEFPKLRKAYAGIVHEKLWEENIEVDLFGKRNGVLQFTGGIFANNKNKKEMQNTLHEIITMLRFSKVNYKWYEYDDVTYYEIKSPEDGAPVSF